MTAITFKQVTEFIVVICMFAYVLFLYESLMDDFFCTQFFDVCFVLFFLIMYISVYRYRYIGGLKMSSDLWTLLFLFCFLSQRVTRVL